MDVTNIALRRRQNSNMAKKVAVYGLSIRII